MFIPPPHSTLIKVTKFDITRINDLGSQGTEGGGGFLKIGIIIISSESLKVKTKPEKI